MQRKNPLPQGWVPRCGKPINNLQVTCVGRTKIIPLGIFMPGRYITNCELGLPQRGIPSPAVVDSSPTCFGRIFILKPKPSISWCFHMKIIWRNTKTFWTSHFWKHAPKVLGNKAKVIRLCRKFRHNLLIERVKNLRRKPMTNINQQARSKGQRRKFETLTCV